MSISTDVNQELLNECFELGPFNGLCRPHPDDQLTPPPTPVATPAPQPAAGSHISSFVQDCSISIPNSPSHYADPI